MLIFGPGPWVVQKVDNPIHWINLYPVDRAIIGFRNTYLLNSNIFHPVMPNTGLKNTWIPGYPLARYSQMLFAQGTLILLASSGFRRQKEIIHVCFLCNKHILAVVIIVLITLNHVSFLHYASKVPVGKVSRESCSPNRQIYLLSFSPWKHYMDQVFGQGWVLI